MYFKTGPLSRIAEGHSQNCFSITVQCLNWLWHTKTYSQTNALDEYSNFAKKFAGEEDIL